MLYLWCRIEHLLTTVDFFLAITHTQAENLNALAKAAGVEVEAYWPTVYARYFQKNGVSDLLKNIGGPAAPAAAAAAPAAAAAAAPAKKEEKKKESESEEGMGMDLFG